MYILERKQLLPTDIDTAWKFMSDPRNLAKITPTDLGFNIKSEVPEAVYEGLLIAYTVSPLFGVPINWLTEITHVRKPNYFCDEQRIGPYRIWHHEHFLEQVEGGVLMRDVVTYALYFGVLARPIHKLIVRPKLERIFLYREQTLHTIFPGRS